MSICFHDGGGGGGVIGVLGEGAKRPSGGRVWEGDTPSHGRDFFSKIIVSKSHIRAFKNNFQIPHVFPFLRNVRLSQVIY